MKNKILLLSLSLFLSTSSLFAQQTIEERKVHKNAVPEWIKKNDLTLQINSTGEKEYTVRKAQLQNGQGKSFHGNPGQKTLPPARAAGSTDKLSRKIESVNNTSFAFQPSTGSPAYSEDRIFVKFREANAVTVQSFNEADQRASNTGNDAISVVLNKYQAKSFTSLNASSKLESIRNSYILEILTPGKVEAVIDELMQLPEVEFAEKVPIYYIHAAPNDPLYNNDEGLYHLDKINAPTAWDYHDESGEIFVAVVDDAFLFDHPDLEANVARDKCYDVADEDDDTRPPSSGDNQASPFQFTHGTHVGGIVAAVNNNQVGIASVSNNKVKVFGIKATRDSTSNTNSIEFSLKGVQKAIENGADVINMSFGGGNFSQTWQNIINEATAEGIIFVSSAGNGNTETQSYPAAYENVIAVANTDQMDKKEPSSHYGEWVDISAPGTDIISTVVANDGSSGTYTALTGTSMSTPMVAGMAGFLLAQDSTLTPFQVEEIIKNTSDPIDIVNPGYEGKLGAGRINVLNALLAVKGEEIVPIANFINTDTLIFAGQNIDFTSHSSGGNLSHNWSFPGGEPSSSIDQTVTVIYNNPGTYDVTLTVNNGAGSDDTVAVDLVVVNEADGCETLNFPQPGERHYYRYISSNTPVFGHNIFLHNKFANRYDFLAGEVITGGLFAIQKAITENPETSTITFKIWGTTGPLNIPGEELSATEVLISDLITTDSLEDKSDKSTYTEVIFDNPIAIPENGQFFIGFEIDYDTPTDTVGFFSNTDGDGTGTNTYIFNEGSWTDLPNFNGLDANIEIAPIIVDEDFIPIGEIVAEGGACIGDAVTFSAEAIDKVTAYQWSFPGGEPSTSTEINPVVTWSDTGTYEVVLNLTLENCEEAKTSRKETIAIVDCELAPVAQFSADKLQIAATDSVQFFDESENATSRIWTFEGGDPPTSSLPNPYVTYNTPGEYTVSLEAQNPEAESDLEVKEQYITVLEEDACDFSTDFSLNDPFPGTPTLYGLGEDGYVTGNNAEGDLAKAEFFDYEGPEVELGGLTIWFAEANATDASSSVTVAIYDNSGTGGSPGIIIKSQELLISDIVDDIEDEVFTEIVFDETLFISGPFYAGVKLSYEGEDTVAIVSSDDMEGTAGTAWEQLEDESWNPLSERWSAGGNPLNAALYVRADFIGAVRSSPLVILRTNASEITQGESVIIDATSSAGYSSFEWTFPEGITFDEDTLVQNIKFEEPGTYIIQFSATNECSKTETTETVIFVEEINCETGTISLNDPFPGNPALLTGTDQDSNFTGYITGHNAFEDKAKAEYFDLGAGDAVVNSLTLQFGRANAANASSFISVAIWESNDGQPGEVLGEQEVLIEDIATDIENERATVITFDEGVNISGSFFGGVILNYENEADTVAIISSNPGDTETSTAWEQFNDNEWHLIEESWNLDGTLSLWISAVVESNTTGPAIEILADKEIVDIGEAATFKFASSSELREFEWNLPDGATIIQQAGDSIVVEFNERGTYTISFTGTNFCELSSTVEYEFLVFNPLGVEEDLESGELKIGNYPNPFNESTKIKYVLEKKNPVRLEVVNVVGKSIAVLVDEEQSAGTYEIDFDANGLPAGVYLYRINIGNDFIGTNRMVIR